MPEAEYSMTDMAMQAGGMGERPKERLMVRFSMFPVQDQDLSAKEGRPIFVEKEYIEIIVPGDKNNIVKRPVWQNDIERFPDAYRQFKSGKTDQIVGTPLSIAPWIMATQVAELEYFHVRTIEQLAELADAHASKFAGIHALRQHARDWLQAAKEKAPLTALRAEIDKKDQELAAANQAISDQAVRLKKLEDKILATK